MLINIIYQTVGFNVDSSKDSVGHLIIIPVEIAKFHVASNYINMRTDCIKYVCLRVAKQQKLFQKEFDTSCNSNSRTRSISGRYGIMESIIQ
jgi:hypothetical protein